MDVYLPIANLSVNGLFIVALGALTGVLSGLFGVGPDGRHSEHRGRRVAGRLVAEAAQEVHDCAG